MNIWKRVITFLSRRKRRSLLLFLILFMFGMVMTVSIGIYHTSKETSVQLQEELGGSFVVTQNRVEEPSLWKTLQDEFGGSVRIYSGPKVDTGIINKIAGVEGIKEYNEEDFLEMYLPDNYILPGLFQDTLDLAASDPRFEQEGDSAFYRNVTKFISNDYSELNTLFRTNSLELTEGRHITKEDRKKILVSETFARNNRLKIGDTVQVEMTKRIANPLQDENDVLYEFEPEIVGIFKVNMKQVINEYTPESLIMENQIFLDTDTMQKVNETFESDMGATKKATFFVKDPAELDTVLKAAGKLKDINWTYYNLEKDDSMYRSSVKPLESMKWVMLIMAGVIWLANLLVLGLLLNMWIQERKREMGILVSVGITKKEILMQLILESLLVAAMAFTLSFVTAGYLAEPVGNKVLSWMTPEEAEPEILTEDEVLRQLRAGEYNVEPAETLPSNTPEQLNVKIGAVEILFVFLSGIMVIMIAVWRSSDKILRRKPREILSPE